jgi:hypothetical protein
MLIVEIKIFNILIEDRISSCLSFTYDNKGEEKENCKIKQTFHLNNLKNKQKDNNKTRKK